MSALLIDVLTHAGCGLPFRALREPHGRMSKVCGCVTSDAVEQRKSQAVEQAAALLALLRKLHEIEVAGQPLRLDSGGISTPCACCAYATWNDWTDLTDAYVAAGIDED